MVDKILQNFTTIRTHREPQSKKKKKMEIERRGKRPIVV